MPEHTTTEARQVCTFEVDKHHFCIEAQNVREVMRYQKMTPVPRIGAHVRGLINLRGQIVTAIDLRRRLSFDDFEPAQRPMNVIVRADDGLVSFLVDRIGDVMEIDTETFEPAPPTLCKSLAPYVTGAFKLDSGLLLLLDVQSVVCELSNT